MIQIKYLSHDSQNELLKQKFQDINQLLLAIFGRKVEKRNVIQYVPMITNILYLIVVGIVVK